MKTVVADLVRYRKAWGLSRDDVAELLNVTPATVYLWETGNRTPSAKALFRWADIVGCNINLEFRGRGR